MIAVRTVQPAVYEIVDMVTMRHRFMSAFRAMIMSVVGMMFLGACGHWRCSLRALDCLSMPNDPIQ